MATKPTLIDPGLPVPSPTIPHWQLPTHHLASISSPQWRPSTDILIIGSGMTACSVALTLLATNSTLKITVLEARGLASGATSRNGGHIVSPSFGDFSELVERYGVQTAVQIAEFTLDNVEATFEVVGQHESVRRESKIRRTEKVVVCHDAASVAKVQRNLELWGREMPERWKGHYRFIDGGEAEREYGVKNATGAVVGEGAAVWPYRLWCGMWEVLLEKYPDRMTIETHTPALAVVERAGDAAWKYEVQTPRGSLSAKHVVYCTNGFASHLLPNLRGQIFPLRGTMSAQHINESFPNIGAERSWSFIREPSIDGETGAAHLGLYYLTQDPESGYMLLGGEVDKVENIISSDDASLNPISADKVRHVLPEVFQNVETTPEVKQIWSGIMGFSRDGLPLVGQLPKSVTSREGGREWIAAGFNGYGTGYCFNCGRALARMILGEDLTLPEIFLVSEERLRGSLTNSGFWAAFGM